MLILSLYFSLCCSQTSDTTFNQLKQKFKQLLMPKKSNKHTDIAQLPSNISSTALLLCDEKYFDAVYGVNSLSISSACKHERLETLYNFYESQIKQYIPNISYHRFVSIANVSNSLLYGYNSFWNKFVIFKHHKQLQKCIAKNLLKSHINVITTNSIIITDIYNDETFEQNFLWENDYTIHNCLKNHMNNRILFINMNGFVNYHITTQFFIHHDRQNYPSIEKVILDFSDFIYYNLTKSNNNQFNININKFGAHNITTNPINTPIDFSLFKDLDHLSISCQPNTIIKLNNVRHFPDHVIKMDNCIVIFDYHNLFYAIRQVVSITNTVVKSYPIRSNGIHIISFYYQVYEGLLYSYVGKSQLQLDCNHVKNFILTQRQLNYQRIYLKNCRVQSQLDLYAMRRTREIVMDGNKKDIKIKFETINYTIRRAYFMNCNITMDFTDSLLKCKFVKYSLDIDDGTIIILINCFYWHMYDSNNLSIEFVIDDKNELRIILQNEYIVRYNMKMYKDYWLNKLDEKSVSTSNLNASCPICLSEDMDGLKQKDKLIVTQCKHLFHYECLQPWYEKNKNCPLCRNSLHIPQFGEDSHLSHDLEWKFNSMS